jgi:hypothetical protein
MYKNIVIVCKSFFPINSPRSHRATELAKELALQGNSVTVILSGRVKDHDDFEKTHGIKIIDMGTLTWKSPTLGSSKLSNLLSRLIGRFLLMAFEFPGIQLMFKTNKAVKCLVNCDLLISIAVPYTIHWGVALARTCKKKSSIANCWIADCGDPYFFNSMDSLKKWFYFSYVEKWFMRKANFITVPVESAKTAYFEEFHNKIYVIPQGFKFTKTDYSMHFTVNDIPSFMYAGGFIKGMRDPKPLLDYLSTLKEDFIFYVYTNKPEFIEPYKKILGQKLVLGNFLPREVMLLELSKMHFIVNFDNNSTNAVPSKLIDYNLVNRPVLNISNTTDLKVISEFIRGDYAKKMILPDINQFKIENVCTEFFKLYNLHNKLNVTESEL